MGTWPASTARAACSGGVTAGSPCSSGGPDGGDEALPQAAPAHRRGVAGLLGSARPPRALLPALPRLRHQALLPARAVPRLPLVGDRVAAGERARHGLQLHRDLPEPGARFPRGAALRARDRRAGRGRAHDDERRRLRAGRRQFDPGRDCRALEDRYGFLVLTAAEVETDYGHVLVYGVNEGILARFDFRNVRLPAQELIGEVARLGGIALPCHPGRPTVGLCAHYETKPPLHGVVAVEAVNGGSRKGEDERVEELIRRHGYPAHRGSDPHPARLVA